MADNALIIPVSFKVGSEFPPYLPLTGGELKPITDCSKDEVAQAVEELKAVAGGSRERLELAYREHVRDVEMLAQVSAYLAKYEQWDAVRCGGSVREILWQLDDWQH
jgi:hypothetical protein